MTCRLQLISDLHVEFMPDIQVVHTVCKSLLTDADVLCIAGDLGVLCPYGIPSPKVEHALSIFCGHYPRVLMVAGNHDYYYATFTQVHEALTSLERRFSPVLSTTEEGTVWSLRGTDRRILACTLWFNRRPSNILYWQGMSDAHLIDNGGAIALARIERRGQRAAKFLQKNVQAGDLLLTHHLPHEQAIEPCFRSNLLNAFFLNDLTRGLLESDTIFLALFGHTHVSIDRRVGSTTADSAIRVPWGRVETTGTRLAANPMGYYGRRSNQSFNPKLVLDIP